MPWAPGGACPEVGLGVDALELEEKLDNGRIDRRVVEDKVARLMERQTCRRWRLNPLLLFFSTF